MEYDYTNLIGATNNFREACYKLDAVIKEEKEAKIALEVKKHDIKMQNWEKFELEESFTNAKLDKIIENESFHEKLNFDTKKYEKQILRNSKDSLEQALNTAKKIYSIH